MIGISDYHIVRAWRGLPDRTKLKVGDQICLRCVPPNDLKQRENEIRAGAAITGWTADTIERILAQNPVVIISEIDEYGSPWFEYELRTADDQVEMHYLAILEDDSWSHL